MKPCSNQEYFFETDAAQAERKRKAAKAGNKHGNPITLDSKLNAVIPDPAAPSSGVLVAESAGSARRLNLESGESTLVYRGPRAPLICLAVGGPTGDTLFAGCWDKAIWSWELSTGRPGRKYEGHDDFVKALVCVTIAGVAYLVSGGADKRILVWDLESDGGARPPRSLLDAAVPMMAVQHLAVDPALTTAEAAAVVSAGSDPHIRRWRITAAGGEKLEEPIREHETGVYKLVFDGEDADLWTASADGTAKCLSRARAFAADDTLAHGDHVRAVVATAAWVATAGRDEDIKVWDRATGRLRAVLKGHHDEVTDMVLISGPARRRADDRLCSVSLDGTVRTWPLNEAELDRVAAAAAAPTGDEEETAAAAEAAEAADTAGKSVLTAEEEAELAELMEGEDDD